jgi:hypothetical protein
MAEPKTLKDRMDDAAEARCDLNIFYGVIAILEGGTVSARSYTDTQRIITICKSAAQKCLRRHDDAVADATRRYEQKAGSDD